MNIELISLAIKAAGEIAKVVVPYVEGVKDGSSSASKKELATNMTKAIYNASPAKDAVPFSEVEHIVSEAIDSLVTFFHKEDPKFQKAPDPAPALQ